MRISAGFESAGANELGGCFSSSQLDRSRGDEGERAVATLRSRDCRTRQRTRQYSAFHAAYPPVPVEAIVTVVFTHGAYQDQSSAAPWLNLPTAKLPALDQLPHDAVLVFTSVQLPAPFESIETN